MEKENQNPMKGMKTLFFSFILIFFVALLWDKVPIIKQTAHNIFNPTLGVLLKWNILYGMIIIVAIFSLITVLIQKYFTDQVMLREIKKEQKLLNEEMKKYKNHPEKMLEFQKKQLEFIPRTMELTMRPVLYTAIPFILFFRWFGDFFATDPYKTYRFFGFMTWFWFYLVFTIIFSSIFRKWLDVA